MRTLPEAPASPLDSLTADGPTAPATAAGASEQFAAWVLGDGPAPDADARIAEAVWEAASASLLGSMRLRSGA